MGLFNFINRILGNNDFDLTNDSVSLNIPTKYSDFPNYNGKKKDAPKETVTPSYSRLTILYKGSPAKKYYDLLNMMGYVQASNVRFDKDNTYVIVEKIGRNTKIAYHIKEEN